MSLDPKTNRLAREEKKAKAAEPPPLEPEFPYRRESFDPFFFEVVKAAAFDTAKPA